jgi:hypothetical protein
MLPRDVLPTFMTWNAEGGRWWAIGGSKSGPSPQTPDLHLNFDDITQSAPVLCLVPGRTFQESTFWQGIMPSLPGNSFVLTEHAGVLRYVKHKVS